ncbi:MAG TPA: hypothetical protein VNN06_17270 [Ramlibacter sp.]|nr:hypothetical protein [Ramlibacter sp.]
MHDLAHRFALIVLVGCGVLSVVELPWSSTLSGLSAYSNWGAGWNVVQMQHWYFMLGILAAGLVVSAFVPALRMGAIGAAVLSKLAYLGFVLGVDAATGLADSAWLEAAMVLALLAAAVILAREAWQEARWNGMLPLRSEA